MLLINLEFLFGKNSSLHLSCSMQRFVCEDVGLLRVLLIECQIVAPANGMQILYYLHFNCDVRIW
jgi:hypothetical protein